MKNYILNVLLLLFIMLSIISCGDSSEKNSSITSKDTNLRVARVLNSSSISIFQNIILEFSAKLDKASVTSQSVFIIDKNVTVVPTMVNLDPSDSKKIIISPYKYFKPLSNYLIVVTTKLKSESGKSLSRRYFYHFVTAKSALASEKLKVSLVNPTDGYVGTDPHSPISIEFNRFIALDNLIDKGNLLELRSSDGMLVKGSVKMTNGVITFIPESKLQEGSSYIVTLKKSVSDMYGNVYDISKEKSSWSFTTATKSNAYTHQGFATITTDSLGKEIYLLRTIENSTQKSSILVATQDSLDIYNIIYKQPVQKPVISKVFTLPVNFQITAMRILNSSYVAIGSAKQGVYIYKIASNSLSEVSHVNFSEEVYDLAMYENRLFSVGPRDGLRVYDFDTLNGNITLSDHLHLKNSIMLNVVAKANKLFIADYNSALIIYDLTDLSKVKKVVLNGSLRAIALGYQSDIIAFNSIGIANNIDFNGNISKSSKFELPNHVKDVNSDIIGDKISICDSEHGVVVISKDFTTREIFDNNIAVSATLINGYSSKLPFIVIATSDNRLLIENLIPDTTATKVQYATIKDSFLDLNDTFSFTLNDDYLDSSEADKQNFVFKNITNSSLVDYTISLKAESDNFISYTITPKIDLIEDNEYTFSIKSSLKDMVGNTLNTSGESINFKANVFRNAKLSLSGAKSIDERSSGKYTISLSSKAKSDLKVNILFKNITTDSTDVTMPSTSYTIKAGSDSVSFDIATIDDNYEDRDKNFSISLVNVNLGGGFSIDTNTTQLVTTVKNNDISDIATISNSSATEGSVIIHIVTMSKVAKYAKTYSYNLPYTGKSNTANSSDYSATPTVSSNVTIDTKAKTITVPADVSSFEFKVSTIDDSIDESSEFYNLSINGKVVKGTIVDNDVAVVSSVSNATGIMGTTLTHTVTMSTSASYAKSYTYIMPDTGAGNVTINSNGYNLPPTFSSNVTINSSTKTIYVPAGVSSFTVGISTNDQFTGVYYITVGSKSGTGTVNAY